MGFRENEEKFIFFFKKKMAPYKRSNFDWTTSARAFRYNGENYTRDDAARKLLLLKYCRRRRRRENGKRRSKSEEENCRKKTRSFYAFRSDKKKNTFIKAHPPTDYF